jgi:2-oxoglutarate ferredoxin oxidoreductase subunit beta
MALMVGATFVGRSFSGDKAQMVPLIMAAMSHPGPAFIDIVSPCVAFNNHAGSTKAYDFVRAHNEAVNQLDIIEPREAITVEYAPGTSEEVALHDGSTLRLAKLAADYDPFDRIGAMNYLQSRAAVGELVTGLIYMDSSASDMHANLNTVSAPLNTLSEKDLCPGSKGLDSFNAAHR